jgi:hypothetical protein
MAFFKVFLLTTDDSLQQAIACSSSEVLPAALLRIEAGHSKTTVGTII